MVDFKTILMELLRDYKSRKFILAVLGVGLVAANKYFELNLSILELVIAVSPAVVFIIIEGVADMLGRKSQDIENRLNDEDYKDEG